MARTLTETIKDVTEQCVAKMDPKNPPLPDDVEALLVNSVRDECNLENQTRPKQFALKAPSKLCPMQVAAIMLHLHRIVKVRSTGSCADPTFDLLAIYQTEGENEGIYATDDYSFRRVARQYNYLITSKELDEVMEILSEKAPRVTRSMDRDLIAVNNGIFNYDTKTLEPFTPDIVFLAKSRVNYNPLAQNVVIHNDDDGTDWDVESWMDELSDDPEIVDVLWQVMSAILRPHVRWNRSAWFYSSTGNNGKGTLCELMRSLCGQDSYASIPLTDFSKEFALEPLVRAQAIIVDENDVGCYIDKAASLKAVITNDVVSINRKFKTPIAYQFFGFMVQCLNEFPRIKDKSDSFYRRQLFVPFTKCFTGVERKYIKSDYLHRREVLEYVLYKVLNMNFYTLSEPAACRQALDEYKDYNDPVRQFADEMLGQLVWDMVPFAYLYDLYKAWFRKNSPNGSIQGKNTFITDLLNLLGPTSGWICQGRTVAMRPGRRMDKPEPLTIEYNLVDWMSKTYTGVDKDRLAVPTTKASYNGIVRVAGPAGPGGVSSNEG